MGRSLKLGYIKRLSAVLFVALFSSMFSINAFAGAKGFAVYRYKVFQVLPFWHSGLMLTDSPDIGFSGTITNMNNIHYEIEDTGKSILHVASALGEDNSNSSVKLVSYSSFLGNKDFMGFFTGTTNPSSNKRQAIINTAKKFYNVPLMYKALNQIQYNNHKNDNSRVQPEQIEGFRCDGFVEYCYEYNNVRVYGTSSSASNWNITRNCDTSRSVHNTGQVSSLSPRLQAEKLRNMLGDIDADYAITSADARLALRYALDMETGDTYCTFVADVADNDGEITAEDARLINRVATEIECNEEELKEFGTSLGYRFPNDPFN